MVALVERFRAFSRVDAHVEPMRLPPVPATLMQHVVWAGVGEKIQVDGRYAGGSAFLTWLADLKRHGLEPVVESLAPQELAQARESTSEDLDGLILLLASDQSDFINGAVINADDGMV